MIVDVILGRRFDDQHGFKDAYFDENRMKDILWYADYFEFGYIIKAVKSGIESKVKNALCRYIREGGYNPEINKYIRSVKWLKSTRKGKKQ